MQENRRIPLFHFALTALLGISLGLPAATAKDTAKDKRKSFSDSTTVMVVEVPVNVTQKTEPLRGLTADDFEVFDGKTQRPIIGFEVVDLESASGASHSGAPAVPLKARRYFLLMLDFSFSQRENLLRSVDAGRQLLDGLSPSDHVGVGMYGLTHGARLMLNFTPDHDQASRVLDAFENYLRDGKTPGDGDTAKSETANDADPLRLLSGDSVALAAEIGRTAGIEITSALDALRSLSLGGGAGESGGRGDRGAELIGDSLASMNQTQVQELDERRRSEVLQMTDSMIAFARSTAGIDGRKYLVLLSEGFDQRLLSGLGSARGYGMLRDMARAFKEAGWTIQSVDPGGVRDNWDLWDGSDSLQMMAEATGGELYQNFNNLGAAMGQLLAKTSVTYLLTVQADDVVQDGKFHPLKVVLKDPSRGVEVSHRAGFYAPGAQEDTRGLADRFIQAERILSGEEGGDLDIATLTVPFHDTGGGIRLAVWTSATGEDLLRGRDDAQGLGIELFAYVLDEAGEIRDYLSQNLGLDLERVGDDLRRGGLKIYGDLALPPGRYELRLLLSAVGSESYGLRKIPLDLTGDTSQLAVLPPIFLSADDDPALVTRAATELTPEQAEARYPFKISERSFIPAVRPTFDGESPGRVSLMAYHLDPSYQIDARVERDGQAIDGERLHVIGRSETEADGFSQIYLQLDPSDLEAGEHDLVVTITDPSSGRTLSAASPFRVVKR